MNAPKALLGERINSWLTEQGYPLEMQVAREFQGSGAHVIQSDFYKDPNTGDAREIDVVATWIRKIEGVLVRVRIVIECKSSKDKPWVLFVSDRAGLAAPARVVQRAASRVGRSILVTLADDKRVQDLPLFRLPLDPGYSLTQAFTKGEDVCYGAISAVANAVLAFCSAHDMVRTVSIAKPSIKFTPRPMIDIAFPVVVTDARLFTARLGTDASISTAEQSSGILLWRKRFVGMPHTVIHVITVPALSAFVVDAKASAEALISLLSTDYPQQVQDSIIQTPPAKARINRMIETKD